MRWLTLSVALMGMTMTSASTRAGDGRMSVEGSSLSLSVAPVLEARLGDESLVVRDVMSYAPLADAAATTVRVDKVAGAQVLNVCNTGGDRFRFRKEAALHPDGSLEITARMRLAAYANSNAAVAYSFYVPLALVKGSTFRALTGKSGATEIVTGTPGKSLTMLRYIAFRGGRKDLVFDLNPYGVTDWQDYSKWGCPTACWSMSVQGRFLCFSFGQRATFAGGTVAGKVRIYEGIWDFERRHPFQRFSYTGASPASKRFTFGFAEVDGIPADAARYTPERTWGWERGVGLETVVAQGTAPGALRSPSGAADAFLIDVEPGYYVLTAGFFGGVGGTEAFEISLNGGERHGVTAPTNGALHAELLGAYARDGKLRLAVNGKSGWRLSRLSVQPLIYRSEDFFLDRGMWMLKDAPDVDEPVVPAPVGTAPPPTLAAPSTNNRPVAEDWRWQTRMTHLGNSVYDSRDSLVQTKDIERRLGEIQSQGYTAVMLDGWHMWCSFQDRLEDWTESTRRRVEIAHRHGLKVVDHFDAPCIVYAGTGYSYLLKHLDWCQRDVRTGEPTFRMLCVNHPDFRQTFLAFLETYVRTTGVDGVMLDECTFAGDEFCGCRHCREKFTRETGSVLPSGAAPEVFGNADHPLWVQWLRWRRKTIGDWWVDVRATLDRVPPPRRTIMLYTTHYGFTDRWAPLSLGFDLIENARGCDFLGTEIMTRNILDSYRSVLAYRKMKSAVGRRFKTPVFAFVYPVGSPDFAYFGWALQHLNNQIALSDVLPGVDTDRYVKWPWQMRKDVVLPVADVAVLFSRQSRDFGRLMPHRDEALGISESLSDDHIQHDFILDEDVDAQRLASYRLLVLPSVSCMSTAQVQAVRAYVAGGGRLLCTGNTSMFNEDGFNLKAGLALRDVLGADCTNAQVIAVSGTLGEAGGAVAAAYSGPAVPVQLTPGSGTVVRAFLTDARGAIVGPAVIANRFGRGETLYLPWAPGSANCEPELRVGKSWAYQRNDALHAWLIALVRETIAEPQFRAVAIPDKVVVSVYRQEGGDKRTMVHLLNATGVRMRPGQVLAASHPGKAFPALDRDLEFAIRLPPEQAAFIVSPDYAEARPVKLERGGDGVYRVTVHRADVPVFASVIFMGEGAPGIPAHESWEQRRQRLPEPMGNPVPGTAKENAMRTGTNVGRSSIVAAATAIVLQGALALAGDNLVANPSAEEGTPFPANWGRWIGGGKIDWGVTADETHSGQQSVYLTLTGFMDRNGRQYVAAGLLTADSKGVTGEKAIPCAPNTSYTFSFWAKGSVPWADVKVLGWKTDSAAKTDREAIATTTGRIQPGSEWKEYTGTFKTGDSTRRFALAFYVEGYGDAGLSLSKTLYLDDVVVRKSE